MNSIDRAIKGIVAIVLWLVTVAGTVSFTCVLKGVAAPDFGAKEVALALGGGLVGFLTAVKMLEPPGKPKAAIEKGSNNVTAQDRA